MRPTLEISAVSRLPPTQPSTLLLLGVWGRVDEERVLFNLALLGSDPRLLLMAWPGAAAGARGVAEADAGCRWWCIAESFVFFLFHCLGSNSCILETEQEDWGLDGSK